MGQTGDGAWGMGHGAWGMGHGAWGKQGMGHGALISCWLFYSSPKSVA